MTTAEYIEAELQKERAHRSEQYAQQMRSSILMQAATTQAGMQAAMGSQISEHILLRAKVAELTDRLANAIAAEREECASIAEAEQVDAESTGTESDAAYNQACDDCAAAIRARGAK